MSDSLSFGGMRLHRVRDGEPAGPGFVVWSVPSITDLALPTVAEMNAGASLEFRGVLWPDEDGVLRVVAACDGEGCALADGHGGDHDGVPLFPLRGFES